MRSIKKAEWGKWKEVTGEKFVNFVANASGRLQEDYSRFSELLHEALDVVIPEKTIKIRDNVKRPYWWNEEVKRQKQNSIHNRRNISKEILFKTEVDWRRQK